MFRHLQKRQKASKTHPASLPTGGSDSDSDSDSDSGSHSTENHEKSSESQASDEETQADSDSDEPQTQHVTRIPESLLKVLEYPIIYPEDAEDTDNEDSESAASADSEGSTSQKSAPIPRSATKALPICLVCPGKLLKTDTLLEEHIGGQTHKRRLARYKAFIHNPPPHTSLSPDASEVIELIDALIGPPPVVQAGSVPLDRKQKRKKRRLARKTQSPGKAVPHDVKIASAKNPPSDSKQPAQQKNKPKKRERIREGKRERQERLAKNTAAEIP